MSGYVPSQHRRQRILLPEILDDFVSEENPVRVIDAFVDGLDLGELGFTHAEPSEMGRPPYDPADLLKLYLYGYLYGVRSSRKLERECHRNLELMWLLRKLTPDFKTIADFRRDNVDHFRPLFQRLVALCKELQLLDGKLVAVDGSKFRAVNAKDRNFNRAKLEDRMKAVEKQVDRYLRELDENDAKEAGEAQLPLRVPNLKEKIARLKERQKAYRGHLAQLEATGASEISLTDPDSRMMKGNNDRMEVSYNTQIAVEAKSKLVVAYDVDNKASDHHQLAAMAERAREALGTKRLTAVADRGYYDGEQVRRCVESGITPYVPEPEKARGALERAGISPEFSREKFVYDPVSDTIQCPAGHRMTPGEEFLQRWRQRPEGVATKIYRTDQC
ncbi:MAG: IS1182 family transposase, partial [Thermoplasmata archaeon]